jgi:CRP-like cAMP-binding protein
MYYLAKGDCFVNARDERNDEFLVNILKEGDHFGEISMIYKCPRSATVTSRNYNTLAKLSEDNFQVLISEYPEYLKYL